MKKMMGPKLPQPSCEHMELRKEATEEAESGNTQLSLLPLKRFPERLMWWFLCWPPLTARGAWHMAPLNKISVLLRKKERTGIGWALLVFRWPVWFRFSVQTQKDRCKGSIKYFRVYKLETKLKHTIWFVNSFMRVIWFFFYSKFISNYYSILKYGVYN